MAVAEPAVSQTVDIPGITRPMSYEEYMATPEEMARYDILDGWKVYRLYGDNLMPSPTRKHQRILGWLLRPFQDFEIQSKQGEAIAAPCDVQITYQPLRSRQPDMLFISRARLAKNLPAETYAPLSPAPELVVEIVSPSDTSSVLSSKLADYQTADVQEVWLLRPDARQVEVVQLAAQGYTRILYVMGDTALSQVFPGLAVPVDSIFQE